MADPEKVYHAYLLYRRYLALLDEVFSGYLLSVPDRVRIGYLELCGRLESLFGQLGYDIDWKVFDSLLVLDEDSDMDWEGGRRAEATEALSLLEREWVSAGQPKCSLEEGNVAFLIKTDLLLESYNEYKRELDKKFEGWAERQAKRFQSSSNLKKPNCGAKSPIRRIVDRLRPDEVNLGIPGIVGAKYKLGRAGAEREQNGSS